MRSRVGRAAATCALFCFALGGCGPSATAPKPLRHVVLISIDTLRADHLGCYGYPRPVSPALDAFADQAVLFEQAWATAPWTLPSHASLLTGLYPSHHGARERRRRLGAGVDTLADRLGRAGLATGAVVNVIFLGRPTGLARGFDFHRLVPPSNRPEGAAGQVTETGLRWLAQQGDRPSFLFLHYFDLHSDYVALPEFRQQFTGGGRLEGRTDELKQLIRGELQADGADVAHLVGLYDASIRQLDVELGRLFATLRRLGRWDDTLIVVTSDHGEEFQDHGGFSHGFSHYEEMLRVPLIVRWPGVAGGRRVPEPVSLVDVVPTLLAAVGIAPPEGLDGIDLSALVSGGLAPAPRTLFAEAGPSMRDELRSARSGDFKLILHPVRNLQQLFDLGADPEERREVSGRYPEQVARLERAIAGLDAQAAPKGPSLDLPPELLEQLRALGYDAEAP